MVSAEPGGSEEVGRDVRVHPLRVLLYLMPQCETPSAHTHTRVAKAGRALLLSCPPAPRLAPAPLRLDNKDELEMTRLTSDFCGRLLVEHGQVPGPGGADAVLPLDCRHA